MMSQMCAFMAAVAVGGGNGCKTSFGDESSAVSPDGKNEIRLFHNPLAYQVVRDYPIRSEERRVGKEGRIGCRSRGPPNH